MPIEIGRGEIANRLRRFLDIRGRIPTKLDENVVPVSLLASTDEPPWRRSPILWADWQQQGPTAGERSFVMVGLPVAPTGIFSVDRVYVMSDTLAAATDASLVMHAFATVLATGADMSPQARRYEQLSPAAITNNAAQPSGIIMAIGSDAAGPLLGAEIDRHILTVAQPWTVFEGPWYVPAGGCITAWIRTANVLCQAGFYGRYWPDVPADPNA